MSEASASAAPPPPPLVQVVPEIQGRGRALVASRAVKPGEVLLTDSPILLYPASTTAPSSTSSSTSFCDHCYRMLLLPQQQQHPATATLFPCPSCSGQTLFCSPGCRSRALASSHTPWVCETLSRLRSFPPPPPLDHPDLRTQVNFLVAAYNLASASPSDFLRLLSLQGDRGGDRPEDQTLTLHSLVASLSPPPSSAGFSPGLTAALLAKDKMNAFGLMEPFTEGDGSGGERRVRAYGIYPNASFFNHDCLPNACRFDYVDRGGDRNTEIAVRAIHDIPEGREVCLSYFPVNWSYEERQRRLLEDYGFRCECDRCLVERDWKDEDEVESMEEEEKGGGDEGMEGLEEGDCGGGGNGDFPHAYFFVRYMCQKENCGGTLAPLPPSLQGTLSDVMECNVCGQLKKEDDADLDGGDEGDGVMLDE